MTSIDEAFVAAVQYHQTGRLREADQLYRQVLAADPGHINALHLLGVLACQAGQPEAGMPFIKEAVRLKPDFAEAHGNLGNAYLQIGRNAEAIVSFRQAVSCKPGFAEAHFGVGRALAAVGCFADAQVHLRETVRLRPNLAEAFSALGNVCVQLGQPAEALASLRQALQLRPDYAEAHFHLGNLLKQQGSLDEAVAHLQQAIRLAPGQASAHGSLGVAYFERGDLTESLACWQQASSLQPASLTFKGLVVNNLQSLCLWESLEAQTQSLIDSVDAGTGADNVTPFIFLTLPIPTTAAQQHRAASAFMKERLRATAIHEHGNADANAAPAGPRRLKVGYLSADFHTHATAVLIAGLFEQHDRSRFEVHGFSHGPDDGSPMRRRLMQAFDRFDDIRTASMQEAARRIRDAGIDILIDLNGHTRGARAQILALRPAPIQVNYLGYPGTMAAPFIDYILVDDFIVPADQQPFFSERLVHLPGCYQVNDSRREIATDTPERAACGLPPQGFVFCSFNSVYKITPAMFSVWMRLLQAVPGSVLWLLEGNRWAPANLRREADARGVSGDRLVFAPFRPGPEHLARHRLADLFLDTFPVNAHTTASDALWAGCPVLTLAGQTMVSRVAGSLLRAVGLGELITNNLSDYESLALNLAKNPSKLADLRSRLQTARSTSSLFDTARFARNLEKALETIWQLRVAGEQPRSLVNQEITP